MGLFKWIKKELESKNLNKRRESAPPLLMTDNFDPNITRDDAYVNALKKFNEYRTAQRLERLSHDQHQPPDEPIYHKILKEVDNENDEDENAVDDDEEDDDDNADERDEESFNQIKSIKSKNYRKNKRKSNQFNLTSSAYKNYDLNISSICKQTQQTPIKETLNKKIYQPEQQQQQKQQRRRQSYQPTIQRYSPSYQTVINKHGEIVEYALPYNEQLQQQQRDRNHQHNRIEQIDHDNQHQHHIDIITRDFQTIKNNNNTSINTNNFDELIDNKFFFLENSRNMNFTNEQSIIEKIDFKRNDNKENASHNVKITDLDKSNESSRYDKTDESKSNGDIFRELDSLEKWSKTIHMTNPINQSFDYFDKNDIIVCHLNDIQSRISLFKNNLPSPMEFSSGIFRNTNVSLRKNRINLTQTMNVAEAATRRDLTILSQIKHTSVALLMAVCYEKSLITLIIEPFDFTLNYLLYQMDKQLTLFHSILIVQQITSALIYLQDSGYIHTNVSSHCVLLRKFPFCAKLSCFELTTEIQDKRNEIELLYKNDITGIGTTTNEQIDYNSLLQRNNQTNLYNKYKQMSKYTSSGLSKLNNNNNNCHNNLNNNYNFDINISSKYLPYNINYRQQFSLHFYQAPELLTTKKRFIYPTKSSDIYSLTLLLWEIINKCIPFVIYNYNELEQLYNINHHSNLPMFNYKIYKLFDRIFKYGLQVNPLNRIMNVKHFYSHLEFIKNDLIMSDIIKDTTNDIFELNNNNNNHNDDNNDNRSKCPKLPLRKSEINDKNKQNLIEKIQCKEYFNTNSNQYTNIMLETNKKRTDQWSMKKNEQNLNDIGIGDFNEVNKKMEYLNDMKNDKRNYSRTSIIDDKKSDGVDNEEEEEDDEKPVKLSKTTNIINFDYDELFKKFQNDYQKDKTNEFETPKKSKEQQSSQARMENNHNHNNKNQSDSILLNSSSILDFNKFLIAHPIIATTKQQQPIYERTSTVKKKKKKNYEKKLMAKDLFSGNVISGSGSGSGSVDGSIVMKNKNFDKIDNELNAISDNIKYSKNDVLTEFEEKNKIKNKNKKKEQFYDRNSMTRYDLLEPSTTSGIINKTSTSVYDKPIKIDTYSNKSIDNLYETPPPLPPFSPNTTNIKYNVNKTIITNSCPQNSSSPSYRFSVGQFTLPDTPIARKNKIRRNAWLSDQKINITSEQTNNNNFNKIIKQKIEKCLQKDDEQINNELMNTPITTSQIKGGRSFTSASTSSTKPTNKKLNVSIKIRHNKGGNVNKENDEDYSSERITDLSMDISKCLSSKQFNDLLPEFTTKVVRELEIRESDEEENEEEEDEKVISDEEDLCDNVMVTPPKISTSTPNIINTISKDNLFVSPGIEKVYYVNSINSPIIDENHKTINYSPSEQVKYKIPFNTPISQYNNGSHSNSQIIDSSVLSKMPEILREAMRKQQERKENRNGIFENSLWRKEKEICNKSMNCFFDNNDDDDDDNNGDDCKVITPKRTSVREAIMKFENNNHNHNISSSREQIFGKFNKSSCVSNKKIDTNEKQEQTIPEENQEELIGSIKPENKSNVINVAEKSNEIKVENILNPQSPSSPPTSPLTPQNSPRNLLSLPSVLTIRQGRQTLIKRTFLRESILENLTEQQQLQRQDEQQLTQHAATQQSPPINGTRKKITTRVTVNFRKTERRASSDIDLKFKKKYNEHGQQLLQQLPKVRHSICGDELCKSASTTLSASSSIINKKNNNNNIISRDPFLMLDEKLRNLTCCKCNKKLQQLNQTSSIDSAATTSGDGGVKTKLLAAAAARVSLIDSKSIEDLYIDDDFQSYCLGANMELIQDNQNDDDDDDDDVCGSDLFSTIDFDILSEEYCSSDDFDNIPQQKQPHQLNKDVDDCTVNVKEKDDDDVVKKEGDTK